MLTDWWFHHPWVLMVLAFVRLLSVWPKRAEKLADNRPRKESLMRYLIRIPIAYARCMLETIWACAASLLATYWAT